jgi:transposase InsO family protein
MSQAAEIKLAEQRLSVLELAQALGNVSAACKQRGVSRTQYYEYKRRFQTHGIEGLVDLPPVHQSHPATTPAAVEERIIELSLAHPAWGCNRLSDQLKLEGISLSAITIQKLLNRHDLGDRYSRWLQLETQHSRQALALTGEQVAFIEKQNPAFRERHVESSAPGELLCQDTFFVGTLKGVGKVYLHTVVDAWCSYAFGFLHTSKQSEAAALVLHNDVLPFYRGHALPVQAVLTDNGREFCGQDEHPYELYLALNDIRHRRTKVRRPQTNGFVERFHRTVLDEFFRTAFRTTMYDTVPALQADLDTWLQHYNHLRPHQGYRNLGKRPFERIQEYTRQRTEQAAQEATQDAAPEQQQDAGTPVAASPALQADPPGAQPRSRGQSGTALDSGEHRTTITPSAGGNGTVTTAQFQKTAKTVRNDR